MSNTSVFFECDEHMYMLIDDAAGAYKIGRASDVQDRMRQLQTGNPNPLRLISTWSNAGFIEPLFHRLFRGYQIRREWYPPNSVPVNTMFEWFPEPAGDVASLLESFGAAMYRAEREADVLPDMWGTDGWEQWDVPSINDLIHEQSKGMDEFARRVANLTKIRDDKARALRGDPDVIDIREASNG